MIQFAIDHPWLLVLLGAPALLASLPTMLRKAEVAALRALLSKGDASDQKALKAIILALVTLAEEKYGEGKGPLKFDEVDKLLAKLLPFIGAEDRKKLINDVVSQLDAGAHEVTQSPISAPVGQGPEQA